MFNRLDYYIVSQSAGGYNSSRASSMEKYHQKNIPEHSLVVLSWVVTVSISTFPDILFDLGTGAIPSWLRFSKMALLLLLGLTASIIPLLKPVRNFSITMFAFFGLFELRPKIDFTWTSLQQLFGSNVFDMRMQAEQTGKFAISIAMILVLLLLGYKRHEFFLTRGNLRSMIKPVKILGFPKAEPWPWFGLLWAFNIAAALAVAMYLGMRPEKALLLKALPMLPSILFYAALNAFNEEITFRAPMLTTLKSVGGDNQALWMSAYFFGIAHYFGTPGGIIGGILSIFMGWILGKAMVETRGLFWAWWIHFLSDVAIFFFIAVTLIR